MTGRYWIVINSAGPMADLKAAIREQLRADGMTQADLARYLGISEKHASQVLTGKVTGTIGMLERMAGAVGLSVTFDRAPGEL